MIDKTKDRWRVEDVYHYLKISNMHLYMQESNKGFVILQPIKGWDGIELFIFCGYSRDDHDVVMQENEKIKEIGRTMGAKRIKFQSNREGFKKLATEMGFVLDYTQFEFNL